MTITIIIILIIASAQVMSLGQMARIASAPQRPDLLPCGNSRSNQFYYVNTIIY